MAKDKKILRTVRFDKEVYRALKTAAALQGRELWFLINEICEDYLQKQNQKSEVGHDKVHA